MTWDLLGDMDDEDVIKEKEEEMKPRCMSGYHAEYNDCTPDPSTPSDADY